MQFKGLLGEKYTTGNTITELNSLLKKKCQLFFLTNLGILDTYFILLFNSTSIIRMQLKLLTVQWKTVQSIVLYLHTACLANKKQWKFLKAGNQKCVEPELHLQDENKCKTSIFNYQTRTGLFTLKPSDDHLKPLPFYKLDVMLINLITIAMMANTSICIRSFM